MNYNKINNDEVIAQVFETTEYEKFSFVDANRPVNRTQVEKLKYAFKQKYILNPIRVNQKFEVYDGQHTLTAAAEIGYPVRYMIVDDNDDDIMRMMNMNNKNWGSKEFVHYFAEKGNEIAQDLIRYSEYYNLNIAIIMQIIYNLGYQPGASGIKFENRPKKTYTKKRPYSIANGDFREFDHKEAENNLVKITELMALYGIKSSALAGATIKAMKIKGFDIDKMIRKARAKKELLIKSGNQKMFTENIHMVYNYGVPQNKKIVIYG